MESNMKTPLYIGIDIINIKQKAMKNPKRTTVLAAISLTAFALLLVLFLPFREEKNMPIDLGAVPTLSNEPNQCNQTTPVISSQDVKIEKNSESESELKEMDESLKSTLQFSCPEIVPVMEICDLASHRVVIYEKEQANYCFESSNQDEYQSFRENGFKSAKTDPLSTFSLDVDAASYSNMRRMINQGQVPPADAIRIEELINYFQYDYAKADENTPVNIQSEIATCPWNKQHYLVKIGVKAKEIASENLPASNFVFLIDVSGSMYGATRLDLVKSSLKLLVNNLREEDRVAIVVYAGAAGEVLSSTSGSDKRKIMEAINNLTAGGSTAGGAGIELAYKIAERNFISNGNNRVILCTDGDFNVGVSSNHELENIIERKRKSGVFLTVLGYGMGNYKDSKMQVLAQKGNGNHAYIDNIQEANKVLVNEFGGTMHAVAKDVKIQVEFNPEHVAQYRLIGYESRLLNKEDFNDDTKDAGELGAGHTVTALYEIIPTGVKSQFNNVDPLKYQKEEIADFNYKSSPSDELLTIKLRYKDIGSESSKKIERIVTREALKKSASADFNFIMSVAMFGQLLKKSDFTNAVSYEDVLAYAKQGIGKDEHGYRKEFIRLAEATKHLK